jgi:acyl carrier protein
MTADIVSFHSKTSLSTTGIGQSDEASPAPTGALNPVAMSESSCAALTAAVAEARADVRGTMGRLIVEVACCAEEELATEANFFHDLDAESIDLLDLSFRAEKAFAVKSPLSAWHKTEQWQTDQEGRLTPETTAWITAEFTRMGVPLPDFSQVRVIKDICTVEFLTRLFEAAVRETQTPSTT